MIQHISVSEQPLSPEFIRNQQIQELKYDKDQLDAQRILIVGTNPTAEYVLKQLLVFGFKNLYLWSSQRNKDGSSAASQLLAGSNHISPHFRNKNSFESLEARAMTSNFDTIGFNQFEHILPTIVINTENNEYISDFLLSHFLEFRYENGLYVDAHSIQDHEKRLYGLNVQAAQRTEIPLFDEFKYIEHRDLSLFHGKEHDPLMSIIAASYASALVARYALRATSLEHTLFFKTPISFTLFPFSINPLEVESASKQVHYKDFFADKGIYLAGLGGGSLVLDVLINLFNVKRLWGVDKDKLERSNFNRLVPFIDEKLIGKKKTKAAEIVYRDFIQQSGKRIKFIDGVIYNDLLIGEEQYNIDVILGCLSGFDNKLNLVALSQKLADKKRHILVDVGNAPFRFDVTNYSSGITPCDYCRNLYDLAVVEYLSNNLPHCDRFPAGSTVFANYLNVLGLIEAMKYVDPDLGKIVTGSISGDLLPKAADPGLFYHVKESVPVQMEKCMAHQRTTPIIIRPGDFIIEEGFEDGWNIKEIYEKKGSRHIGRFRYIPK